MPRNGADARERPPARQAASQRRGSGPIAATPQPEENSPFARLTNPLAHYSGDANQRVSAEAALKHLADLRVALSEITEPGILLADDEVRADPLHLAITGAKADAAAKVLFSTMPHMPPWNRRVEWWDRSERGLPNPDVGYPPARRAAAFVCTANRCSLPIFSAAEIVPFLLESTTAKPTAAVNTTATHD